MKKSLFYTVLLTTTFLLSNYKNCAAQSEENIDLYTLGNDFLKKNQYLRAVDSIQKLRYLNEQSGKNKTEGNIYDHALALFSSFIGEEYQQRPIRQTIKDSTKVRFTRAIPYIIQQAKKQRIVMINEDHNIPKHRLLSYNLLADLYKTGYRYLAVEALVPEFPQQFNLDYPGLYILEPNMANLLKKARELGYKLVAYESQDTTAEDAKRPYLTDNLRELNQANNLRRIFTKDPKAKVLVHAGHGHIWEKGNKNMMTMAEYFKAISGIDPLTINQSVNNADEFKDRLDASPDLKNNGEPYLVLNEQGLPGLSAMDQKGAYDLLLAWPGPKERSGRKDYMLAKKDCKQQLINVTGSDAGKLLQIRTITEGEKGIPVDQFLIKEGTKQVATALPPGKYQLQLSDQSGSIIWKKKTLIQR